jgi:hypothetical protein
MSQAVLSSTQSSDAEALEERLLQSLWTILMMLVDEHMQSGSSSAEAGAGYQMRPDQQRWLH